MTKWLLLFCFAVQPLMVWSAPQTVTSGEYKFYVDDTPRWIKPVDPPASSGSAANADAVSMELIDTQISVRSGELIRYQRLVSRVNNQAGAEAASQIPIHFIPNFQKLTIHGVWVTRDGRRVSRLDTPSIRLVATESDLDRRIYRGIVTAVVFVRDLQVGDLLELGYSVSGRNPVLAEHTNFSFPLSFAFPVKLLHARALAPTRNRLELKILNSSVRPVVRTEGEYTDTSFLLHDTAKLVYEPRTPPEAATLPIAQFSDFRSWEEVSQWAQSLFSWKGSLPAEVQARVKRWQAQSANPLDAARLALDYVQKDIRYVSVALGENALRPAPPEAVIQRGFGDCKDKSLLLVSLLRSMGITASPALVSTLWEGAAFDLAPDAGAFDHVIVLAEIGGRKYWLDGTNQFQAGSLEARFAGDYGKALVVGHSASVQPVLVPVDYSPAYTTTHRYVITKFSEPVDFFIEGSYRGSFADGIRARVQLDRSGFEKEGLERYKRFYPTVELIDALRTRTDEQDGRLDASAHYRIPEFFEYDKGALKGAVTALNVFADIGPIEPKDRKTPWRLRYPQSVVLDVLVEFPEAVPMASAEPISIKDDYIAFSVRKKYDGTRLTLHFECKTLARSVPPSAIAGHNDVRKRIAKWLAVEFSVPTVTGDVRQPAAASAASTKPPSTAQLMLSESEEEERAYSTDIASGRLTSKQLSRAYLSRAWAREHMARYEDAVVDTRRALELDAGNADALESLAFELKMLRRFEEAHKQYEQAEPLLQDHYGLHMGRGQLNYYSGQFAQAQADFRRAAGMAKKDDGYEHALIWLYLATAKAGADPKAEIQPYLDASKTSWPGPAVNLLLGNSGVQPLYEAARSADQKTELKRLCEAHFFVGQYYLLKGDVAQANRAFEQAVATDVREYVEYVYAKWELQRTAASR